MCNVLYYNDLRHGLSDFTVNQYIIIFYYVVSISRLFPDILLLFVCKYYFSCVKKRKMNKYKDKSLVTVHHSSVGMGTGQIPDSRPIDEIILTPDKVYEILPEKGDGHGDVRYLMVVDFAFLADTDYLSIIVTKNENITIDTSIINSIEGSNIGVVPITNISTNQMPDVGYLVLYACNARCADLLLSEIAHQEVDMNRWYQTGIFIHILPLKIPYRGILA